eukprot:542297-Hanusia_phi.AAC.1
MIARQAASPDQNHLQAAHARGCESLLSVNWWVASDQRFPPEPAGNEGETRSPTSSCSHWCTPRQSGIGLDEIELGKELGRGASR